MTQRYLFFNSVPGDPRVYQASDFASYFGNVLSTGVLHIDNVPGLKVKVVAGTLQTAVESGGAIMRGHLYENTDEEVLTHSLPESSLDRIDRIVLRLDSRNSERNILLHIIEGNPASNPVPPDLQRDNFIYELSLAQVRVRANTSSLQASDLIDERFDKNLCGLVYSLLGNSELERQFNAHLAKTAADDVHGLAFKGALVTMSANQSLAGGSMINVILNDPTYEIRGTFLDMIKIVIPSGVKKVRLSGQVAFSSNSTGLRAVEVTKNESGTLRGLPKVTENAVNGSETYLNFTSPILEVIQGDYFRLRAQQTSGSSLTVLSGGNYTWLAVEVIE